MISSGEVVALLELEPLVVESPPAPSSQGGPIALKKLHLAL